MRNPRRKTFTREEVAKKQEKAVRFLRDVVGDPDLADEIEALALQEFAQRKRIQIANPKGGGFCMPKKPTYADLQEENEQLWSTLEDVYEQLGDLLDEEEEEADEDEED